MHWFPRPYSRLINSCRRKTTSTLFAAIQIVPPAILLPIHFPIHIISKDEDSVVVDASELSQIAAKFIPRGYCEHYALCFIEQVGEPDLVLLTVSDGQWRSQAHVSGFHLQLPASPVFKLVQSNVGKVIDDSTSSISHQSTIS
ncbi:hypothetical protein FRC12_019664 [Ceratobasidium sp. 428]|nr:hypothetical protein FRC12_019664 [Ceratobasidium sp. 428]